MAAKSTTDDGGARKRRRKGQGKRWTRPTKKAAAAAAGGVEKRLSDVYYQYGERGALQNNLQQLLREVNEPSRRGRKREVTLEEARIFLSKQPSYTVHHRVRSRQFPRRNILVPSPQYRLDGDLLELRDLSPWNSGYNYALVIIDAFTRFVWTENLKNKESGTTAAAFEKLHRNDPGNLTALFLYTDGGREFLGAPFQSTLKKLDIQHRVSTAEEFHCPFAERVIRTLKEKVFQAMTAQHTRRWIDLLPKVVNTYNQTDHRGTGMTPNEAKQPGRYLEALRRTYPPARRSEQVKAAAAAKRGGVTYRFKVGDLVRILKSRGSGGAVGMNKGYLPNFSWEIFRVRALANKKPHDRSRGPPAYILEDLNGEEIEKALFYEPELVRVHPDQLKGPQPVREILAQKGDRVLVWFQGHPKSSAIWLPRENLV